MFTRNLRSWVDTLKEGEIFLAKQTYDEYFSDMEEGTFYQLLARIYNEGYLGKLAKGLYFKPYYKNKELEPNEDHIVDFLTNHGRNGMLVGSHVLAKKEIIDKYQDDYLVYTNLLEIKTVRVLHGVEVRHIQIDFRNENYVRHIEMLELIESIDKYSDVNYYKLKEYLLDYAAHYDQTSLLKVLSVKKYKKRNISILHDVLNYFKVYNTLGKLLNKASIYKKSYNIEQALLNEGLKC